MKCRIRDVLLLGLTLSAISVQAADVDFERDVAPILIRRCLECHQAGEAAGGLVLDRSSGLQQGGDSGAVIDSQAPADSLLVQYVSTGVMPPERRGQSQQLAQHEVAILRQWVLEGAQWPPERVLELYERTTTVRAGRDWWSLQPVHSNPIPDHADGHSEHPIDRFVREQLAVVDMVPAPLATPRERIRRIFYDTTGLPPSYAEIERFAAEHSAADWDALIDQQLASPHFGEKWARHWLDVVRFAETSGYERDQAKPFAWKYRDWVVDAFNSDMPYDEFVIAQLAGDEVADRTEQTLIATGFLRLGTWNDEPNDPEDDQYDRLEDLVHATSSAFLGMTVKCARCHDHKFDPIPQTDYYRMAAIFWPGPIRARDRKYLGGPTDEELGASEILGWTDLTSSPAPLYLLKNGDRHQPQEAVAPASLSLVPQLQGPFHDASQKTTTGRRLQMARWITDPDHPLTPRVIVNRIWQGYFGHGLVRSPNNFGFTGDRPTHPQLLDWLAQELIEHDWSLKHIHRLILTSQTYQQSANHPQHDAYAVRDFDNRWLWRAHRKRLDAEGVRDAILSGSGNIDLTLGGPSFQPAIQPAALEGLSKKGAAWQTSPPEQQNRRSLYIYSQRSLAVPMMSTFDQADTTLPCGKRESTTVAPQALALLNNEFVHKQADVLAQRVMTESDQPKQRIRSIFRSVLGRLPTQEETQLSLAHLERQRARFQAPSTSSVGNQQADSIPGDVRKNLVLELHAATGVQTDEQRRVQRWDGSGPRPVAAVQPQPLSQPQLVDSAIHGRPAIAFHGEQQFLSIDGALPIREECTIFAVVTDNGPAVHREILSNWNRAADNIGTSVFLGLTGENTVRFSDALPNAGQISHRQNPFLLSASTGTRGAEVWQNRRRLSHSSTPLPNRRFETPWVIGQQGDIEGEYWHGMIAAILVFDRQLSADEQAAVRSQLARRYALPMSQNSRSLAASAESLALSSLAVVLFNSNEFLYVD